MPQFTIDGRSKRSLNTSTKATEFLKSGQPAISVDTKKKEQVGDYKNGGREWRPTVSPNPSGCMPDCGMHCWQSNFGHGPGLAQDLARLAMLPGGDEKVSVVEERQSQIRSLLRHSCNFPS